MLELTHACPLACVHCYLRTEPSQARPRELGTAEVMRVVEEVRRAGCMFLGLTGGEISTRGDLLELVRHSRGLGLAVYLSTTGLGWTATQIQELAALYPAGVNVSLYSADPAAHDRITGREGSHAATLAAVRLFVAHGLHVTAKCVLMHETADGMAGVLALGEELGVQVALDATVWPTTGGDTGPLALRSRREQLERFFAAPQVRRFARVVERRPTPHESICAIGKRSCVIGPAGDVYACSSYRRSLGNVRQQSFAEIWHHSPHLHWLRGLTAADLSTCSACEKFSYCNRCAALALSEDHDFLGPSSWACQLAEVKEACVGCDQAPSIPPISSPHP
ncbi:MAG: radical SAM protein [Acidobacteriota bacterium]